MVAGFAGFDQPKTTTGMPGWRDLRDAQAAGGLDAVVQGLLPGLEPAYGAKEASRVDQVEEATGLRACPFTRCTRSDTRHLAGLDRRHAFPPQRISRDKERHPLVVAAAVPEHCRKASGVAAWRAAVKGLLLEAGVRSDCRDNVLRLAQLITKATHGPSMTSRPGWDALIDATGFSKSSIINHFARLKRMGLIGVVATGRAAAWQPKQTSHAGVAGQGLAQGDHGRQEGSGDQAVYVLTVPASWQSKQHQAHQKRHQERLRRSRSTPTSPSLGHTAGESSVLDKPAGTVCGLEKNTQPHDPLSGENLSWSPRVSPKVSNFSPRDAREIRDSGALRAAFLSRPHSSQGSSVRLASDVPARRVRALTGAGVEPARLLMAANAALGFQTLGSVAFAIRDHVAAGWTVPDLLHAINFAPGGDGSGVRWQLGGLADARFPARALKARLDAWRLPSSGGGVGLPMTAPHVRQASLEAQRKALARVRREKAVQQALSRPLPTVEVLEHVSAARAAIRAAQAKARQATEARQQAGVEPASTPHGATVRAASAATGDGSGQSQGLEAKPCAQGATSASSAGLSGADLVRAALAGHRASQA